MPRSAIQWVARTMGFLSTVLLVASLALAPMLYMKSHPGDGDDKSRTAASDKGDVPACDADAPMTWAVKASTPESAMKAQKEFRRDGWSDIHQTFTGDDKVWGTCNASTVPE